MYDAHRKFDCGQGGQNADKPVDKPMDRLSKETEAMGERWTTIADAASRLGISTKTVRRRVKAGELPSRKTDSGHVEVNVDIERTAGDNYVDSLSMLAEQSERQLQAAGVAIEATRHLADAHKSELQRVRRGARIAWAAVWIGVVTAGVAVWHITQQSGLLDLAEIRAGTLTKDLQTTEARAHELQEDLHASRHETDIVSQAHRTAESGRITAEARLEATSGALQATEDRLTAVQGELTAERQRIRHLTGPGQPPAWLKVFTRRPRPSPTSRPAG